MAIHAPITGAPSRATPLSAVETILSQFDRKQLASFIEVAIGLLDATDGDPDLEDDDPDQCPASDDIGTHHAATEKMGWDSALGDDDCEPEHEGGQEYYPLAPVYGADQSRGAINEVEIIRDWKQRELGLVPNGGGGWRVP